MSGITAGRFLLAYTKTIANEAGNECGSFIEQYRSKLPEFPIGTVQISGMSRNAGRIFAQTGISLRKRAVRIFSSCLFSIFAVAAFFCFLIAVYYRKFLQQKQIAVILDYIHNMDGKKKLS